VTSRVAEVVTQLANAAASLLFPRVAMGGHSSTETTERVVRGVTLLTFLSALCLGVVAAPLLGIVFGSAYATATGTLWLLLIASVPLAVSRMLAGDLKGRGRPGIVSVAASAAVCVTVVGDLLAIPPFGIAGAAFVSILAYGANALVLAGAYRAITGASLGRLVPTPSDATALARWTMEARRARRAQRAATGEDRIGTPEGPRHS
jgi:stage V sporulation protein B